tara:strand:+ start:800 stop:1147 length:348 start_codon:yes stop_codon:yes gene_type:complete
VSEEVTVWCRNFQEKTRPFGETWFQGRRSDDVDPPPCRMFCLDFAVAFVAHYAMASRISEALQSHPVFTFTSGAVAGAAAAVLLYPVDQRVERGLWQATTQPISDEHAGFWAALR